MPTPFKTALATPVWPVACTCLVRAAEAEPALIGASAQVAAASSTAAAQHRARSSRSTRRGSVPADQHAPPASLGDGPRRLVIRLMRDISAKEFEEAVLDKLAKDIAQMDARVVEQMNGPEPGPGAPAVRAAAAATR